MASSWTPALPTHPCSSTSGWRTRRMTLALWDSTAPVTCAVRVPQALGAPWPGHTRCRASGVLRSLRLYRPSSQAPSACCPVGSAPSRSCRSSQKRGWAGPQQGCRHLHSRREAPGIGWEVWGLAWPNSTPQTEQEAPAVHPCPHSPPNQVVSLWLSLAFSEPLNLEELVGTPRQAPWEAKPG